MTSDEIQKYSFSLSNVSHSNETYDKTDWKTAKCLK